ncbi:dnaj domain containing protein [Dermatophagoides farinae]|nr:dnaJ homolog subfamily C member 25 homolog isoform X2 [Dermatophagoides farinae]XP_046915455.1 dnaJ homolog subfamily C member 25 homolog isoform X2 [Dermatophagoides farinae]KAH7640607.1 dnaj domain containing protein [Dermatophagoides farinae]
MKTNKNITFIVLFITTLINNLNFCHAFLEGLYCGQDNCYDVLKVTRETSKEEISRSYRSLARKWHPDLHRGEEAKAIATKQFQLIAQAYEVLRDDESRKDYDYMLDNPEEYYHHYYRYYRRVYAPKVDVRIVIVVTITLISIYQYYGSNSRYKEAIDYFVTVPKYRIQAKDIAIDEGIWPTVTSTSDGKSRVKQRGSGNKQKLKEELKQEEEACIRKVIEDKMNIKGAYSKPSYKDILWVQLFLIPVFIAQYIYWHARWIYKFDIKKEPLGEEEKHYIMRKFMNLSEFQWAQKDQYEIDEYMREELWIRENFEPWKKKKDDDVRAKLAENSAYKRYRRYMRKGGPGQITFLDD